MTAPFVLAQTPLPHGVLLLEASAGTGKTFTITGIVLRLLLEGRIERLSEVLVVTYTIAATQELKTRIRKALQQAERACAAGASEDPFLDGLARRYGEAGATILRRALRQADEMSVATIHSFCKRVLDEAAFASGSAFGADLVPEDASALLAAAQDAVRIEVQGHSLEVAELAKAHDLLPGGLLAGYRMARRHRDTTLQPPPQDLDATLAALPRGLEELRALARAGDLPVDTLGLVTWKKTGKDFWSQWLPKLTEVLASDAPVPQELLARLSEHGLEEHSYKNSKVRPPWDHPAVAACTRLVDLHAQAAHDLRARLFARMDERLSLHKQTEHTLNFDDLLLRVHEALHDPGRQAAMRAQIQRRWRIAVIDEFQDTDQVQYEVFRACFADRGLYLVGDPKQSIYAFRGADVHAYLAARKDATAQHTLAHNYRSSPDAVAAVGALFGRPEAFCAADIDLPKVEAALPPELFAVHGDQGKALQFRLLDTSALTDSVSKGKMLPLVSADVAAECARMLGDSQVRVTDRGGPRRLRPRDFAVLTRSHQEARAVQQALRARGVHAAVGKAGDLFSCPEFDDLLLLLLAWSRPTDQGALRAAWTTPLFGLDEASLRRLLQDEARMEAALQRFQDQRQTLKKSGVLAAILDLLEQEGVRRRLLERADGERKLTNYLQVAEVLHYAQRTHALSGEALRAWMLHERHAAAQVEAEWRELRLESDADAVQILTTHASKGLQYEIVFAPFFCTAKRLPKPKEPILVRNPQGGFTLHFGATTGRKQAELLWRRETLAEDLRLLYVAVTRARRRCILHLVESKSGRHSPLGYLMAQHQGDCQDQPPAPAKAGRGKGKSAAKPAKDRAEPDGELTLAQWRQATASLAALAPAAIEPIEVEATRPTPARDAAAVLRPTAVPRALPKELRPGWRTTSFTQLQRRDGAAGPEDEDQELAMAQEPPLDEPEAQPEIQAAAERIAPRGFLAFARGAHAGICLHEILEKADFQADAAATRAGVDRLLQSHGLDQPDAHRGDIEPGADTAAMLQRLLALPLPKVGFALRELASKDRAPEWRFLAKAGRIAPSGLAEAYLASQDMREYAERLRKLSSRRIEGFLTGSIDLLAQHEGRYYVFDWKSNWLGPTAADYAPERLRQDMQEQDYVLQYHLYLLAVHLHLQARLPGYDYDTHIGGACYVYLRGIDEDSATSGAGVFFDRPDQARIEAMARWLTDGGSA